MSATPNMNLNLPGVSVTLGPAWARMINAALGANATGIDGHDHTFGKGVQIPTAGLNLDADLPFNGLNATLLRSTRYSDQSAALVETTDLGCIYNAGGNLYWNNGSGTAVQITNGASVNAGAGSIAGLPSGTASAAFAISSFVWRSETNVAATMDAGPVVIRDIAASALGITLKSPAGLAGAYSLTLPATLPAGSGFLRVNAAGTMSASVEVDGSTLEVSGNSLQVKALGIGTAQLAALSVTKAKLAAETTALSLGSGAYSNTTTSYTTICSVSFATTGRPLVISVQSDDTHTGYFWLYGSGALGHREATLSFLRSGSAQTFGATLIGGWYPGSGAVAGGIIPPGAMHYVIDSLAAGTYTFTLQGKITTGTGELLASNVALHVYEL